MKCFEIGASTDDPSVQAGLRIERDGSKLYVPLRSDHAKDSSRLRVNLAPASVDRLPAYDSMFQQQFRILSCDVEQRSELWLHPETAATENDLLLLLHVAELTYGEHDAKTWTLESKEANILAHARSIVSTGQKDSTEELTSEVWLIRLPRDYRLTLDRTHTMGGLIRKSFERGRFVISPDRDSSPKATRYEYLGKSAKWFPGRTKEARK